jgi:hypothetical protein
MYPNTYLSLFPPFPRNDKVFVAMSFDEKFRARWDKVICPAVSRIERRGNRLEAFRVDARKISDSILTEILSGISTARLVLADVSTIKKVENKPIRNGNVMYEVGIAHAARLPEEVLLFRSDNDPLLFDMANGEDTGAGIPGASLNQASNLLSNLTYDRVLTSLPRSLRGYWGQILPLHARELDSAHRMTKINRISECPLPPHYSRPSRAPGSLFECFQEIRNSFLVN